MNTIENIPLGNISFRRYRKCRKEEHVERNLLHWGDIYVEVSKGRILLSLIYFLWELCDLCVRFVRAVCAPFNYAVVVETVININGRMCSSGHESSALLSVSELSVTGLIAHVYLHCDNVYRAPRFCEMFSWKLLLYYTTRLGCMTAAVLPTSPGELARKPVTKPGVK